MFFNKNEKKKKHHTFAIMVGALAMFGAYSAVTCMKSFMSEKMSCMMNKLKRSKSCKCADSCECEDDASECE